MRILLVEDELSIASFIRQGLSEAGYAVDVVGDGNEALEYALVAEYDAILLDILLTALKGRIEVILSRARTHEEYEQALADLGQDVERLIRLSGALLMLARLDQQQSWQVEALDLSDLLETMLDSLQPLVSTRTITLAGAMPPGLFVRGDFDQLTRLFLNLLDNAIKYTPPCGRITVRGEQSGENVSISIHDTGTGIAPEHLPHLFERFYRVEVDRTRSTGGAGLGLSIAYEIARKHGGSLDLQSTVATSFGASEQGTTAFVCLPYCATQQVL